MRLALTIAAVTAALSMPAAAETVAEFYDGKTIT